MSTLLAPPATTHTLEDMLHALGDVPPARIRVPPFPGAATEQDVLEIHAREKRLCELVDGMLVEKPMGYRESLLAAALLIVLDHFVFPRKLGLVSGEAGMMRLFPGLIRIPDVAFVSWERIPSNTVPTAPAPAMVPDLAVEVLSESNTPAEMERKRREYFDAGVRLVWMVDPEARTVAVFTGPATVRILTEVEELDGGDVLPDFRLPLATLFGRLDQRPS